MPAFVDRTGQRYGRLVAISYEMRRQAYWLCRCDCGKQVVVQGGALGNGTTQSCGCFAKEQRLKALTKHGCTKFNGPSSPTYISWLSMRRRCTSKKDVRYPQYGGRGITVCERWLKFENFLEDMGERPEGLTLERKNNDGNYEPGNCVWATDAEQDRNKSNNIVLTFNGRTQIMEDWAQELGINTDTIRSRLLHGWTVGEALSLPVDHRRKRFAWGRPHRASLDEFRRDQV